MRTKLALLFYQQSEFQINEKADAFEALDKILNIFHAWLVSVPEQEGKNLQLNDCLDRDCLYIEGRLP